MDVRIRNSFIVRSWFLIQLIDVTKKELKSLWYVFYKSIKLISFWREDFSQDFRIKKKLVGLFITIEILMKILSRYFNLNLGNYSKRNMIFQCDIASARFFHLPSFCLLCYIGNSDLSCSNTHCDKNTESVQKGFKLAVHLRMNRAYENYKD